MTEKLFYPPPSHPYQKNTPKTITNFKSSNVSLQKNLKTKNQKTHRSCKTALCGRRASFLLREANFIGLGKREGKGWEQRRRGGGRGGDKGGRIAGFKKQHCPERWKGTDGRGECGPQSPEERGNADRSCCFPLTPECSSVGSRGQCRGQTSVPSGSLGHWRWGSLRKRAGEGCGEGKQLWPQREGQWGACGLPQPSLLACPGRSAQRWSGPWQRWRKGQQLGPKVSASFPETHWGRHVWDKIDTLREGNEENIPNAFGGLRHSNYNKQETWVFEGGQRFLPSKSHIISWSLRAEKGFGEETRKWVGGWPRMEGIQASV